MRILNITECPEHLDTVVDWEGHEWGDAWGAQVRDSTAADRVPTIYVALADDHRPLGCAMLVGKDMTTRPDLTPWLGGVYVPPEHRRRGLATALSRHVMQRAQSLGIDQLWLYTLAARPLYERLGWQFAEMADYQGEQVTLMSVDLRRWQAPAATPIHRPRTMPRPDH